MEGGGHGESGGMLLSELSLSSRDKWPTAVRRVVEQAERAAVAAAEAAAAAAEAEGGEGRGKAGGSGSGPELMAEMDKLEAKAMVSEQRVVDLQKKLALMEVQVEEERLRGAAAEDEGRAQLDAARAAWAKQRVRVSWEREGGDCGGDRTGHVGR